MNLEARGGQPARVVTINVGFSCHTFTCDVADAGSDPELYSDDRETRAFDIERYQWSQSLMEIVIGLEQRKCYFAGREQFVTFELNGAPSGCAYRVFFRVRRRDSRTVDLIVQSAYVGPIEKTPFADQRKKLMRFKVVVSKVLLKQPLGQAR
jgi:hypothetical protein